MDDSNKNCSTPYTFKVIIHSTAIFLRDESAYISRKLAVSMSTSTLTPASCSASVSKTIAARCYCVYLPFWVQLRVKSASFESFAPLETQRTLKDFYPNSRFRIKMSYSKILGRLILSLEKGQKFLGLEHLHQ